VSQAAAGLHLYARRAQSCVSLQGPCWAGTRVAAAEHQAAHAAASIQVHADAHALPQGRGGRPIPARRPDTASVCRGAPPERRRWVQRAGRGTAYLSSAKPSTTPTSPVASDGRNALRPAWLVDSRQSAAACQA